VFALTGAGISSDSGLPTFRGAGGLWRSYRVEELASPAGFARDPVLVWNWYDERRAAYERAQPNAGHRALAEFEARHAAFTLATQNVDSLHLRAGSKRLFELHGHLREARCTRCTVRKAIVAGEPFGDIRHGCGGMFRPGIVWFGESLPPAAWQAAARAAREAEVVLVAGTSGLVEPAASLATRLAPRAFVIEINPEATPITEIAAASVRGTAAAVLPQLLAELPGSGWRHA
jgi:NAD-dependent deacetylase